MRNWKESEKSVLKENQAPLDIIFAYSFIWPFLSKKQKETSCKPSFWKATKSNILNLELFCSPVKSQTTRVFRTAIHKQYCLWMDTYFSYTPPTAGLQTPTAIAGRSCACILGHLLMLPHYLPLADLQMIVSLVHTIPEEGWFLTWENPLCVGLGLKWASYNILY